MRKWPAPKIQNPIINDHFWGEMKKRSLPLPWARVIGEVFKHMWPLSVGPAAFAKRQLELLLINNEAAWAFHRSSPQSCILLKRAERK